MHVLRASAVTLATKTCVILHSLASVTTYSAPFNVPIPKNMEIFTTTWFAGFSQPQFQGVSPAADPYDPKI